MRVAFSARLAASAPGAEAAWGCTLLLTLEPGTGYVSIAARADDTNIGVDIGASTPPDVPSVPVKPIDRSQWVKFVFEMKDITANGVALAATVDGAPVPLTAPTMPLAAPPMATRLVCGIDDTRAATDVYVDDIDVSICTR